MYFAKQPGRIWVGGHVNTGIVEPSTSWFHAEGATGGFFNTFILLSNPQDTNARVDLRFLLDTGEVITRQKTIGAKQRLTVNPATEGDPRLENAAVSTVVTSDVPIVSERAMYWSTTGGAWREAHNSFGVTAPGLKWGLAEGRAGGERGYQTYVLVSNSTSTAANLEVTFIREDGVAIEKSYTVAGGQRYNIHASDIAELANSHFATIVESINGVNINVESAIYWNSGGVIWEAGGNTVATPIP